MQIPGPGTIFMSLTTRFKAPVRIGDTVVTTCTVREVNAEKAPRHLRLRLQGGRHDRRRRRGDGDGAVQAEG